MDKRPARSLWISLCFLPALLSATTPSSDAVKASDLIAEGKFEPAVKLLTPLVAALDADALMLLGVLHASGAGVPKDSPLANDLWRQSALAGQADAARLFLASAGLDRFARTWWQRRLATMPEPAIHAPRNFVSMQQGGLVVEDAAALKWIQRASANGDAIGLYNAYQAAKFNAMRRPEAKERVRRLLERAAEAKLPEALMELSSEYEQSVPGIDFMRMGYPVDLDKAASLMKQAAEMGNPRAQLLWAHWLGSDKRQFKNKIGAANYYRRSSDQGDSHAAYFLARAYGQGLGVAFDEQQSKYFLELAAMRGNDTAIRSFAPALFKGDGMPQDQARAIRMLEQTAVTSILVDVDSLDLIAYAYATGEGVERDDLVALWWCDWAVDKGSKYAGKLRDQLRSRVSAGK
jgi:TPR repeat protein